MRSGSNLIEETFEAAQNRLVVQSSDFSLSGLKDMVDEHIIDLSPEYQRRERWEIGRQSQLIESFLLNVPVPPIYLAEEEYGQYSIIDGKQRISSVSDYLNNAFALRGLDTFTTIEGLRFRDLPRGLQNALRVRPYLRVITLLRQSDPALKYEVFIRLNRGGIQLNNQEIRNVAFRGPLNEMIYRASSHPVLKYALKIDGPKSSAFKQMLDAEYVLRFLTLHNTWKTFSGSFSKSMDLFMLSNRTVNAEIINEYENNFSKSLDRCNRIWGEAAFQRWDDNRWRKQFLAGMYDAQMIAVYMLSESDFLSAHTAKKKVIKDTITLFERSDFEEAVRLGTNTPARLRTRVEAIYKILVPSV